MYIDGKFVDAVSGKTFKAVNPTTGEETAEIPLGGKGDVDKALLLIRYNVGFLNKMP